MKYSAILIFVFLFLNINAQEKDAYSRAIALKHAAQNSINPFDKTDKFLQALELFQEANAHKQATEILNNLKQQTIPAQQKIWLTILESQQKLLNKKDQEALSQYNKIKKELANVSISLELKKKLSLYESKLFYFISLRSQTSLREQALKSNKNALSQTQDTDRIARRIAELELSLGKTLSNNNSTKSQAYIKFLKSLEKKNWPDAQDKLTKSINNWAQIKSPARDRFISQALLSFADFELAKPLLDTALAWPNASATLRETELKILAKHGLFQQFKTKAKPSLIQQFPKVYEFAAFQAMNLKKEEQAIYFFQKTIQNARKHKPLEASYLYYAKILENRQIYDEALKLWQDRLKASQYKNQKIDYLRNISRLQGKMNLLPQAEKSLQKAITLSTGKDTLLAKQDLFHLYLKQKKHQQAIALGETLRPQLTGQALESILYSLANIFYQQKKLKKSLELLEKSNFKNLSTQQAFQALKQRFQLAIILNSERQKIEQTLLAITKIADQSFAKDLFHLQVQFTQLLYAQQAYKQARHSCLKLLAKKSDPALTFLLAQIYEQEGKLSHAFSIYAQILDNKEWHDIAFLSITHLAKNDNSLLRKAASLLSKSLTKTEPNNIILPAILDLEASLIKEQINHDQLSSVLDSLQEKLTPLMQAKRQFIQIQTLDKNLQIDKIKDLIPTLSQNQPFTQKLILSLADLEDDKLKKIEHYQHYLYLQSTSSTQNFESQTVLSTAQKLFVLLIAEKQTEKITRWMNKLKKTLPLSYYKQLESPFIGLES